MGTSVKLKTKANPARKQLGRAAFGFATPRKAFVLTRAVELREIEHGMAEESISFDFPASAIGFEPGDDVGIEAHGDGFFRRAIELADFGCAPIENRGSIQENQSRGLSFRRWPGCLASVPW